MLNSISKQNSNIKILNYNVHIKNYMDENQSGVAIGVRKDINYKILDDFNDDFIGVQIEAIRGPIVIYTTYIPPRRNYLPIGDFKRAAQRTMPVYIIGDLNTQSPITGYNYFNNKGRILGGLMTDDTLKYVGPDFSTFVHRNGHPDAILANKWAFLNVAIHGGNVTTSDHIPVIVKLNKANIQRH